MPSLQTAGHRFESTFVLDDGRQFRGVIDTPADRQMPSYQFTYPRRILKVRIDSLAQINQTCRAPNGVYYLLSDNDEAMVADQRLYKSFRLFTMDQLLPWVRPTVQIDPITGVEQNKVPISLGMVRCTMEALKEDVDRQMHIARDRFHLITNAAVQMNDTVNGLVVKRLNPNLGVMFAEVQ